MTTEFQLREAAKNGATFVDPELLYQAADEIESLRNAIEAMRVAGGSAEFQAALDRAKELLK